VTDALWEGFLPRDPAKIKSSRLFALIVFLLNRPKAKHKASIMFDFPAPLGPTMQVKPLESFIVTVRSPNDLKPVIDIFLMYVKIFLQLLPLLLKKE
jgi:hypothetical protein